MKLLPSPLLPVGALAGLIFAVLPASISAQTLFSENFDDDHTANWTLNASAGTHPVNFFFDYNTIGIPSAPIVRFSAQDQTHSLPIADESSFHAPHPDR